MTGNSIFTISSRDSLILKGIAICAMLFHHIYACAPAEYAHLCSNTWVNVGVIGKCCVSIFLFCSGYGLAVNYNKLFYENNNGAAVMYKAKFVLKRLLKFYFNYWFIFLIFVPISIFVFNISLNDRYGEAVNIFKRLIRDLLGLQGFSSYNITWWFNKLIILLYLAFPFIFWLVKKFNWLALIGALVLNRVYTHVPQCINPVDIFIWQFAFTLGIFWNRNEERFGKKLGNLFKRNIFDFATISILLLCATVYLRQHELIHHFSDIRMDAFISVAFALCTISFINKLKISNLLSFLGKHSANIYLIHTFFGGYWFPNILYYQLNFKNLFIGGGISMFIIEMTVCLLCSMLLEWTKEKIGIKKLTNTLLVKI